MTETATHWPRPEFPPEPETGTAVRDGQGLTWVHVSASLWTRPGGPLLGISWTRLMMDHSPLTLLVPAISAEPPPPDPVDDRIAWRDVEIDRLHQRIGDLETVGRRVVSSPDVTSRIEAIRNLDRVLDPDPMAVSEGARAAEITRLRKSVTRCARLLLDDAANSPDGCHDPAAMERLRQSVRNLDTVLARKDDGS